MQHLVHGSDSRPLLGQCTRPRHGGTDTRMHSPPDTVAVMLEYPVYDQADRRSPAYSYFRPATLPLVDDEPGMPRLALVEITSALKVRAITVPTEDLADVRDLADDGYEHVHAITRAGRVVSRIVTAAR